MAEIRVNPTRMELKKLRVRYETARRGHKLLKDKRDELMRLFLEVVSECKSLREEVQTALAAAHGSFTLAAATTHPKMLEAALLLPKAKTEIAVSYKNRMSVTVPVFECDRLGATDTANYGLAFTSGELDAATATFGQTMPLMLRLAEREKEAMLLAQEIERTRRRVNALEHIMMPQYLTAIKSIKMKLDENERGNITRLMKVKDMILKANLSQKYSYFPDEE
ncbi:MAG: V-type ATP synthase subunit D [Clostridia bacterium]|nr:V-type ATP synthase subunit D [Clostridia bacterium]